jgi:putative hydrolase of the HAD superfamily
MRKPLGVIFDLGDTVLRQVSFEPIVGNERLLQLAENASGLSPEDIQPVADELSTETLRLRDEHDIEFTIQSFQRLLYDGMGVSFSVGPLELEREFWHAAVTLSPADGIVEALDALDEHGIRTGILSNTPFTGSVLVEELEKHGLAHRFSFVIASADYGLRKPHPRIFQVAVRKMGLAPEDIWFVGDKPEYDIKGANDSGLCPVWYNPPGAPNTSGYECLEVRSWREFIEKIESLS